MQLLSRTIDLSHIYGDKSWLILSVSLKATEERLESGSVKIMMGQDPGGLEKYRILRIRIECTLS
jgi:hypothetical protein